MWQSPEVLLMEMDPWTAAEVVRQTALCLPRDFLDAALDALLCRGHPLMIQPLTPFTPPCTSILRCARLMDARGELRPFFYSRTKEGGRRA